MVYLRTAVVIGSTGLTGHVLVEKLALNNTWTQVLAITRKPVVWKNPKIRNISFDFQAWSNLELQVRSFAGTGGTDFFCTLGTTIKLAGSQQEFRKIDLEAVVHFAQIAKSCAASSFVVVSSLGADENSNSFYLRTKGEMEKQVSHLKIDSVFLVRPSLLLGDRSQFRLAERLAMLAAPLFSLFLFGKLKKYQPVKVESVALVMINLALKKDLASAAHFQIEVIKK